MIRRFVADADRLRLAQPGEAVIWTDLLNPDQADLDAAATEVGVEMPSRADMEEIETSSRLYIEGGVAFLTAALAVGTETEDPVLAPITFVLGSNHLWTIRHHDPRIFSTFPDQAQKAPIACSSAEGVMLGLLDAVTDRLADVLERVKRSIDDLSRTVFRRSKRPQDKSRNFQATLEQIGRDGDLVSMMRESLTSLERLVGFLSQVTLARKSGGEVRRVLKTVARDVHALIEYTAFLGGKITLLLDATLGMINIEQSGIIKIFSVAAVVFLPPTLIASIYGMNFAVMPELGWSLGYPFAIVLMIISAILPYQYFKRRGWL